MERNDKHIDKFLRDPLPSPEIPADEAWAGMSGMLDAPATSGASGQADVSRIARMWKSIGKLKGFSLLTAAVATVSTVVAVVTWEKMASVPDFPKTGKNDSLASHAPAPVSPEPAGPSTSPDRAERTNLSLGKDSGATDDASESTDEAHKAVNGNAEESNFKNRNASESRSGSRNAEDRNSRGRNASESRSVNRNMEERTFINPNVGERTSAKRSVHERNSENRNVGERRAVERRMTENSKADRPIDLRNSRDESVLDSDIADKGLGNRSSTNRSGSGTAGNALSSRQGTNQLTNNASAGTNSMIGKESSSPAKALAAFEIRPGSLQPHSGYFKSVTQNLGHLVKKPAFSSSAAKPVRRRVDFQSILEDVHFGPEWSLYLPVNGSDYLLTGADSIKRPARIAVPGVFVSKNWGRHAATFVFTPLHTYFGNKDLVAQRVDTIRNSDSTFIYFYNKTNFIKATGWNVSLQYQYEATSWLSISGGASYAKYSRALFHTETSNSLGNTITGPVLTTKGSEATNAFIQPQQWTLRAGLIAHPRALLNGRLQIGTNMIWPMSNLSRYGGTRIRSANAQVFLRLMVR